MNTENNFAAYMYMVETGDHYYEAPYETIGSCNNMLVMGNAARRVLDPRNELDNPFGKVVEKRHLTFRTEEKDHAPFMGFELFFTDDRTCVVGSFTQPHPEYILHAGDGTAYNGFRSKSEDLKEWLLLHLFTSMGKYDVNRIIVPQELVSFIQFHLMNPGWELKPVEPGVRWGQYDLQDSPLRSYAPCLQKELVVVNTYTPEEFEERFKAGPKEEGWTVIKGGLFPDCDKYTVPEDFTHSIIHIHADTDRTVEPVARVYMVTDNRGKLSYHTIVGVEMLPGIPFGYMARATYAQARLMFTNTTNFVEAIGSHCKQAEHR